MPAVINTDLPAGSRAPHYLGSVVLCQTATNERARGKCHADSTLHVAVHHLDNAIWELKAKLEADWLFILLAPLVHSVHNVCYPSDQHIQRVDLVPAKEYTLLAGNVRQ